MAKIACVAANFRVPFHVFSETYKFSDQNILDAFAKNELADPNGIIGAESRNPKLNVINLRYDLTPKENVNMVRDDRNVLYLVGCH